MYNDDSSTHVSVQCSKFVSLVVCIPRKKLIDNIGCVSFCDVSRHFPPGGCALRKNERHHPYILAIEMRGYINPLKPAMYAIIISARILAYVQPISQRKNVEFKVNFSESNDHLVTIL